VPPARRQRGAKGDVDDHAVFSKHPPETLGKRRLADVSRRIVVAAIGSAITNRDRLQVSLRVDDRLQKRGVKRQHLGTVGRRSLWKNGDGVAGSEHFARVPVDSVRVAAPTAFEEERPGAYDEMAEQGPVPELGLGDEARRSQAVQHEHIEP